MAPHIEPIETLLDQYGAATNATSENKNNIIAVARGTNQPFLTVANDFASLKDQVSALENTRNKADKTNPKNANTQ